MNTTRGVIPYALIGIGVLFLIANLGGAVGWLWVGLAAVAFLVAYAQRKSYGLLVTGSLLAGLAVGLLIGTWPGLMLSLGAAFLAIDRVEPRSTRWPRTLGVAAAAIGVLGWLIDSGFFGSILFAMLLVGAGLYLLLRRPPPSQDEGVPVPVPPPTPSNRAAARAQSGGAAVAEPPVAPPRSVVSAATEPELSGSVPAPVLEPPVTPPGDAAPTPEAPETALSPEDARLAAKLAAWRRRIAAEQGVSAYLVLTNDTLNEIARRRPRSREALAEIRGIGPVKMDRYADAILALVAEDAPPA